jgi:hypothetical protein
VDHVVDDRELGVELRRLVFEQCDVAAKKPRLAVARGGDGRVVVRF